MTEDSSSLLSWALAQVSEELAQAVHALGDDASLPRLALVDDVLKKSWRLTKMMHADAALGARPIAALAPVERLFRSLLAAHGAIVDLDPEKHVACSVELLVMRQRSLRCLSAIEQSLTTSYRASRQQGGP